MSPEVISLVVTVLLFVIGGVFSFLWWLLKKKDDAQESQIKLLFAKNDGNAERLHNLELHIAKEHYVKDELDKMFDRLEITFREGFTTLGGKFDDLSKTLTEHLREKAK